MESCMPSAIIPFYSVILIPHHGYLDPSVLVFATLWQCTMAAVRWSASAQGSAPEGGGTAHLSRLGRRRRGLPARYSSVASLKKELRLRPAAASPFHMVMASQAISRKHRHVCWKRTREQEYIYHLDTILIAKL